MSTVPHDPAAEEAVIGGCLSWTPKIPEFSRELEPADFYLPRLGALWRTMLELSASGGKIDQVTILAHLNRSDVDMADLIHLQGYALMPTLEHVAIIRGHRFARDLQSAASKTLEAIAAGTDPVEVSQALESARAGASQRAAVGDEDVPSMDEFLDSASHSPWLIQGLIKRDWRVFLVAGEGAGKSTLLRMVAMMASQGIHPFTCKPMAPLRALVVDLENPVDAVAETGNVLRSRLKVAVGDAYDPERCRIFSQVGGFDLRRRGALQLEHVVAKARPDLVVLGPLYKISSRHGNEDHEAQAEGVQAIFDELRTRYGFALMVEHHAPASPSFGKRDMRPFGSSLWMRWPEIGIGLNVQKDGALKLSRFRGDRMASDWPSEIRRGSTWPFEGTWKHGMSRESIGDELPLEEVAF